MITFCILYLHNFYISKLQFSRSVFSDIVLPFKLKNYLGGNLGQKSDIFGRSGRGRVLYTWAQVEVVLLREPPSDGSHPVSTDLRVKPHTCSST